MLKKILKTVVDTTLRVVDKKILGAENAVEEAVRYLESAVDDIAITDYFEFVSEQEIHDLMYEIISELIDEDSLIDDDNEVNRVEGIRKNYGVQQSKVDLYFEGIDVWVEIKLMHQVSKAGQTQRAIGQIEKYVKYGVDAHRLILLVIGVKNKPNAVVSELFEDAKNLNVNTLYLKIDEFKPVKRKRSSR